MLSGFERRAASLVFWLLFLVCTLYVVGAVVGIAVMGVYVVQAAMLYIRAAREEWIYGEGAWSQFVNTQSLYRNAVTQNDCAAQTAQDDPDQVFLSTYSGGGETITERLIRWGKRLLFMTAACTVWIPAMVIHGAILLIRTIFTR